MHLVIRRLKLFALTLFLVAPSVPAQEGRGDVVYVPTPQVVVDEMLRMAKVGPSDFVIDLGSGDGRIIITAAKKYGARGFGVDLDTYLLKLANENARKEGVTDRARFIEQNLFETDLSRATVITSYLLPEMNEKLRPKILALKPGTRVVAHDYAMGEWEADDDMTLVVPEKTVGDPGKSYIFLWIVPARIAGRWESQVTIGGRPLRSEFRFEQHFQMAQGTARVGEWDLKLPQFRLEGEQLSFSVTIPVDGRSVTHRFAGKVNGDTIEGTVTAGEVPPQRVTSWTAKQTARAEPDMGMAEARVVGAAR